MFDFYYLLVGKQLIQGMLKKFPGGRLGAGHNGWEEVRTTAFFELEDDTPGDVLAVIIGQSLPYGIQ